LATPDFILGEVPKTNATSLGGTLEILEYVFPSVTEYTQKLANIINNIAISINTKVYFNMVLIFLKV
jgi:hypothetical protein